MKNKGLLVNTNYTILIVFVSILLIGCQTDFRPRLNDIQIIGSHNSYKTGIQPELWNIIFEKDSIMALELDYEHISLTDQLNLGLRNLEIDVLHDPVGGRYASPKGQHLITEAGGQPDAFDVDKKMYVPGLKVLHIQDLDFRSNCFLFKDCLKEIKMWSNSNNTHIPIIITINTKQDEIDVEGSIKPLKFDSMALDSIDLEILSVIGRDKLITPDFVREKGKTLEETILSKGWPALDQCRGKFMFILDQGGKIRDLYLADHPSLQNRIMFSTTPAGSPESSFLIINDPISEAERIKDLVRKGYMVRTRADAGTWEARNEDYRRFNAALKSGAHVITTDYYLADKGIGANYKISFDEGEFFRLNPFTP